MFGKLFGRKSDPQPPSTREAAQQLMAEVMQTVMEVQQTGDIAKFDALFVRMDEVQRTYQISLPGMAEKLQEMRASIAVLSARFRNMDAAHWAGDNARSRLLLEDGSAQQAEGLAPFRADGEAPSEGVDVDALFAHEGKPDLFGDVAAGKPGAVAALIASGVDLNAVSGPYDRPAFFAALEAPGRNLSDLKALIEAGADPFFEHPMGSNALCWAVGYKHKDSADPAAEKALVRWLVSLGIDPNDPAGAPDSLTQVTVHFGSPALLEAVLAAGSDPDVVTPEEFMPAFLAGVNMVVLAAPKPEMVKVLLSHVSDPLRVDRQGRNPLEFVAQQAREARDRAALDPTDAWLARHAEGLETSLGLMRQVAA